MANGLICRLGVVRAMLCIAKLPSAVTGGPSWLWLGDVGVNVGLCRRARRGGRSDSGPRHRPMVLGLAFLPDFYIRRVETATSH